MAVPGIEPGSDRSWLSLEDNPQRYMLTITGENMLATMAFERYRFEGGLTTIPPPGLHPFLESFKYNL